MVDPERGVEMALEGDSNEVSGSPTGTVMDYKMDLMFSSPSPLYSSVDYSFPLWIPASPGRRPQSPEWEISLWSFPSPSRLPSPQPGVSRLISSYGSASSSNQPPVRSPSPPFRERGDRRKLFSLQPRRRKLVSLQPRRLQSINDRLLQLQLQRGEQLLLLGQEKELQLRLGQQFLELQLCLGGVEQLLLQRRLGQEKELQLRLGELQLCLGQLRREVCLGQLRREVEYSLSKEKREKRELHKFIQNASQITLQIKIKMADEICKGHDNTSIDILDKMTVAAKFFKLHFTWTKAPWRHRSQNNASDLKKSCTSFDGCYKHQDCMFTVKLEICIDFYDDRKIFQELFSSYMPFFPREYTLVRYGGKIESQDFHPICEPSADDEPDSRCELTHISHCTRSPPGPNGLPDGEEMRQQDSRKHQLMEETHAMNDGENVLSYGGIHSAVSYPENEGPRKTAKRKITIEDLQHFSGSRNDAANHFGVSVPTIKRCLRDHKITDWRNRNIDKNNQCLSEPKEIMESFPGEEAEMGNQMAGGSRSCEREFNHEQIGSDRSQIGVGLMEESSTRLETSPMGNMFASSAHELCVEAGDHSELPVQPSELNLSATRLEPDAVNSTLPQIPERELLMENSGSSRELSDHYISATEAFDAKQVSDSSRTNLSCSDPSPKLANTTAAHMMPIAKETQDTSIVTVKATYRDEMVKFKLPLTSGIIELKKKVAKKQELEVDSFSIKYLDDENEWIVMKDDVDLQQCFNDSISLGRNIRLLIHDSANSGAPDKAKGD